LGEALDQPIGRRHCVVLAVRAPTAAGIEAARPDEQVDRVEQLGSLAGAPRQAHALRAHAVVWMDEGRVIRVGLRHTHSLGGEDGTRPGEALCLEIAWVADED
jgi:hypothetical protein